MLTCERCEHYDPKEKGMPEGNGRCYGAPPSVVLIPIPKQAVPPKGTILNPNMNQPPIAFDMTTHHPVVPGAKRACGAFKLRIVVA